MNSTFDIKFRRMDLSDLPRVKDICEDVYGGHDTLPTLFPKWVESDCNFLFGLEILNSSSVYELVAFGNIFVAKKKVAWLQGLRVHRNYRRLGFAEKLQDYGVSFCKNSLGVKRVQYVTSELNVGSVRISQKFGFKIITRAPFWKEKFPFSLDSNHNNKSESLLEIIPLTKLVELYSQLDPATRESLVPNASLLIDFTYENILDPETILSKYENITIYAEISKEDNKLHSFSIIAQMPTYNDALIYPNENKNAAILHMINIERVLPTLEKKYFDVHLLGKYDHFDFEKSPDDFTLFMDLPL